MNTKLKIGADESRLGLSGDLMNKVIEASATTTAFNVTPKVQDIRTNSKRKSNNIVMASS